MPLTSGDIGGCCCAKCLGDEIPFCNCACLPSKLQGTHSILGDFTLAWNGSGFDGTSLYSYPGCCGCPPESVTITWQLTCVGGYEWWIEYSWRFILGPQCPSDLGTGNTASAPGASGGDTCVGTTPASCGPFRLAWSGCTEDGGCASGLGRLLCDMATESWSIEITADRTPDPSCCHHPACNCANPTVPATLYLTHSLLGPATLKYNGLNWSGSSRWDVPACDQCGGPGCPAATVTISWTFSAGAFGGFWCGVQLSFPWDSISLCPGGAGDSIDVIQYPLDIGYQVFCDPVVVCSPFSLSMTSCYGIGGGTIFDALFCQPGCPLPQHTLTVTA